MHIKALPSQERPLEKVLKYGVQTLSNAEILALIIHTGTKEKSAIRLAEEILSLVGCGVHGLASVDLNDLVGLNGIGPQKACTILAAVELGKRIAISSAEKRQLITSSRDVSGLFMEKLRYEKKEHFKSVLLNVKGELISCDDVSVGELSSTVVHPREVFSEAIRKSAAAIIFVHNHPSGDPKPSKEDVQTTARLVEAGRILGINVLDHIIIGDGKFSSLKTLGYI